MGQRPLLLGALHEHRDRRPNALIDEDHESLVLVTKKNGEATAGRSYGSDLHFDDGFAHTVRLYSPSRRDPNYCPPRQSISRHPNDRMVGLSRGVLQARLDIFSFQIRVIFKDLFL